MCCFVGGQIGKVKCKCTAYIASCFNSYCLFLDSNIKKRKIIISTKEFLCNGNTVLPNFPPFHCLIDVLCIALKILSSVVCYEGAVWPLFNPTMFYKLAMLLLSWHGDFNIAHHQVNIMKTTESWMKNNDLVHSLHSIMHQ